MNSVVPHSFCANSYTGKALWRSCYTNRYAKTSATRAYADYRSLKAMIAGQSDVACELFDETLNPLPTMDELLIAGWPGRRDRLPRAMLATALRRGGLDFADGAQITKDNYVGRELHHLYPVQVLEADRTDVYVSRALNCALISWATNRKVGAKSPRDYIERRTAAAALGEEVVRRRLQSHLVPYDALIAGDYEAFLTERARLIQSDMLSLCHGVAPP